MPLVVKQVSTQEELTVAKAIRYEVFIHEHGFEACHELDPRDDLDTTRHFLGKQEENGAYVAVARCLLLPEKRKAKVGRVAVLKEYRGRGYGVALMRAIEDALFDEVDVLELSSINERRGFYEARGYTSVSGVVYIDKGVEHCQMSKTISKGGGE
ncbi:hypothetical protein Poli38472_009301 [Pythium oligandrum]|uniref:N-acetyltransferase domain-containing protein n=1 Tax=Pythium oligandrum TaxID=41045 RepID=A0A8K1CL94_PYTOL|nr:hypothetical protein Poli38472_009301 [Pythium oligandrum]|eukprot:TMW65134.1 hypothetical protein Poli38472_009301 [Pythium oligandrum]